MLFIIGDVTAGEASGLVVVTAAVTAGLTKLADYLLQRSKDNRTAVVEDRRAKREDEDAALTRMEALLDRAERQLEASQRENNRFRADANRATVRAERAIVWIQHLESRLREHKIPFDEWTEAAEVELSGPPGSKTVVRGQGDVETDIGDGGYV